MTQNPPPLPIRVRPERSDKSAARIAIERALQDATAPMTRLNIATLCGVPMTKVQAVLNNLCTLHHAHRVPPTGEATEWCFGWGGRPTPSVASERPPLEPRATHRYDGADLKPYTGRPGAMDAFALPSIHNGQRVERRAPIIMGSTPTPKGTR